MRIYCIIKKLEEEGMSIIADIVVVAIFIAIVVYFTRQGFDQAIFKIGKSWTTSLAVAVFVGPLLKGLIEALFLRQLIFDGVLETLTSLVTQNANGYNLAELFDHLPEDFVSLLDSLGASLTALEAEFGSYANADQEIIATMADRIATPLIDIAGELIGYVVSFFASWAFFAKLEKDFEINKNNKFFMVMDHISGFIAGVAVGFIVVFCVSTLVKTGFQVAVAIDSSLPLMEVYEGSFVFKFLGDGAFRNLF